MFFGFANAELDKTEMMMNLKNRMQSTEIEYDQEIQNMKTKFLKSFQNIAAILHMQPTPDDGLWMVQKRLGQFW